MKIDVNVSGLDGVLNMLKSLPPEIVSKRGGPVKTALRKAAQVIHKQAKINLQSNINGTNDHVEKYSTGLLLQNVIVSRGKAPTDGKGERYLVRVKRKTYQDRHGKPVTTLKTAQIKEYGSSKQPAEPWLRPAFESKASEAIRTAETELIKAIDRITNKLRT